MGHLSESSSSIKMKLHLLTILSIVQFFIQVKSVPVPHGFFRITVSLGKNFPLDLRNGGPKLWNSAEYLQFESSFVPDLEAFLNADGGNKKYIRALETKDMRRGRNRQTVLILDVGCENGCFESEVKVPIQDYIKTIQSLGGYPASLENFNIVQYPAVLVELPENGQHLVNTAPCPGDEDLE